MVFLPKVGKFTFRRKFVVIFGQYTIKNGENTIIFGQDTIKVGQNTIIFGQNTIKVGQNTKKLVNSPYRKKRKNRHKEPEKVFVWNLRKLAISTTCGVFINLSIFSSSINIRFVKPGVS